MDFRKQNWANRIRLYLIKNPIIRGLYIYLDTYIIIVWTFLDFFMCNNSNSIFKLDSLRYFKTSITLIYEKL